MTEFIIVPDDDDEFDPGYPKDLPDDPGDVYEREGHPEDLEEDDYDG